MWRMHTCYDEAKRSNQFVFPDLFSMSMPTWKRIVIIFIPCPNNSPQHKFKYHQLHMKLYGMCLVVHVLRVKEVTKSQKPCFLFVTADMAEKKIPEDVNVGIYPCTTWWIDLFTRLCTMCDVSSWWHHQMVVVTNVAPVHVFCFYVISGSMLWFFKIWF